MPIYEYECQECGVRFERFQNFSDDPIEKCPECGGPVRRLIGPVGIIFKGPGFYVTDHPRSGSARRSSGNGKKETKSEKKESKD